MLVSCISAKNDKKIAFGSKRDDYEDINSLATGETPILPNRRTNILAALKRFSNDSSDANVQFLLDTASSVKYGVKQNSEFAKQLGTKNPAKLENTDWYKALDNAIKKALESSDSSQKSDFEARYREIFTSIEPLSQEEKEILEYREAILSSEEMKNAISSPEKLSYSADIVKNLDYFTVSSEISQKQKHHCLKQMAYFLSPEYQINPQLKDKKLQALSEILNDIVIKTPDNPVMSIKSVDQRETGMCAAISICRKALAYEDKSRYLDIIMQELNSSKQMEVFDVTKLGKNVKVNVNKADIDYEEALDRGYRIIDASAHNWMYLAQNSGDGRVENAQYIPFDKENDEIFQDSVLYRDLEGQDYFSQNVLRLLIKEREVISRIEKTHAAEAKLLAEMSAREKSAMESMSEARTGMIDAIKALYPNADDKQVISTVNSIMKPLKSKNHQDKNKTDSNEINIKEPQELTQSKIKSYILSNMQGKTPVHPIEDELASMYAFYVEYRKAEESVSKTTMKKTREAEFAKNKSLYKLALIHRNVLLTDLAVPGKVLDYERKFNLPTFEEQFDTHVDKIRDSLVDPKKVEYWAKKLEVTATREKVEEKLRELQDVIDIEIPHKTDNIISQLGLKNRVKFLKAELQNIIEDIKYNDADVIKHYAMIYDCKAEPKTLIDRLNKDIKSLEKPDRKVLARVARNLEFETQNDIALDAYDTVQDKLENNDKDTLDSLFKRQGSITAANDLILKLASEINEMPDRINEIAKLLEFPDRGATIIRLSEKEGLVLKENELDILRKKFESVRKEKLKREQTKARGEEEDKSQSIYLFTPQEKELLKRISDNFSRYRKSANAQYKVMNSLLYPKLEELYASYGKQFGSFWVREEGHTGLSSAQQIRIFEQMTGDPYYQEKDIDTAVGKIKQGAGSGVVTTSVLDNEYAMHAQYSPQVSKVNLKEPGSGKNVRKEVLWQDNSWGNSEGEEIWSDNAGNQYTSYSKGYGGKGGYLLSSDHKIGKTVDYFRSYSGVHKKDGAKVSQFFDMVMPGYSSETLNKLHQFYDAIFDLNHGGNDLNSFEDKIRSGQRVNADKMEKRESFLSNKADEIFDKLELKTYSREEFEALPEDNSLRFMVEKQAMIESIQDSLRYLLDQQILIDAPEYINFIYLIKAAQTQKDLKECKEEIREIQMQIYSTILNKEAGTVFAILESRSSDTLMNLFSQLKEKYGVDLGAQDSISELFNVKEEDFDGTREDIRNQLVLKAHYFVSSKVDNPELVKKITQDIVDVETKIIDESFTINSIDDLVLGGGVHGFQLQKLVEQLFNPKDDDEFIEYIHKIQNMNKDEYKALMKRAPKGLSVKYKDPYITLQKLQTGNFYYMEDFRDTVYKTYRREFYELANSSYGKYNFDPDSVSQLYSEISADLSYLTPEKLLRRVKKQFFDKYKVLPAFPKSIIFTDEELEESIYGEIDSIAGLLEDEFGDKKTMEMMNKASEFKKLTESGSFNRKQCCNALKSIYEISSHDSDLEGLNEHIKSVIDKLSDENSQTSIEELSEDILIINTIFASLANNSYSESSLEKNIDETKQAIKKAFELLIDGNVESRYRNSAREKLQIWMRKFLNEPEKDSSKEENEDKEASSQKNPSVEAYNSLVNEIVKRHITKNPLKLFETYIKEMQEPNPDENLNGIYRYYMEHTLNVAKQSRVEYYLMDLADSGIATKLSFLQDAYCYIAPNGERVKVTSDEGFSFLMKMLSYGGNNSLLNLFLLQTGLSERAVEVITGNLNIPREEVSFHRLSNIVLLDLALIEKINKLYMSFLKDNAIQYDSLQSAGEHWLKTLESNREKLKKEADVEFAKYDSVLNIVPKKSQQESLGDNPTEKFNQQDEIDFLLDKYTEALRNDFQQCSQDTNSDFIIQTLNKIHGYAYKDVAALVSRNIYEYKNVASFYKNQKDTLNSIKILNPELIEKRNQLNCKIDGLLEFFQSSMVKISAKAKKANVDDY